jgi:hypothetical protein
MLDAVDLDAAVDRPPARDPHPRDATRRRFDLLHLFAATDTLVAGIVAA